MSLIITKTIQEDQCYLLRLVSAGTGLQRELFSLTKKFENWKDPLSQKLQKWSGEIVAMPLTPSTLIQESFKEKLTHQIHKLIENILIDPLTKAPFTSVLLDKQRWSFEKWMLEECKEIMRVSPFDKR